MEQPADRGRKILPVQQKQHIRLCSSMQHRNISGDDIKITRSSAIAQGLYNMLSVKIFSTSDNCSNIAVKKVCRKWMKCDQNCSHLPEEQFIILRQMLWYQLHVHKSRRLAILILTVIFLTLKIYYLIVKPVPVESMWKYWSRLSAARCHSCCPTKLSKHLSVRKAWFNIQKLKATTTMQLFGLLLVYGDIFMVDTSQANQQVK